MLQLLHLALLQKLTDLLLDTITYERYLVHLLGTRDRLTERLYV